MPEEKNNQAVLSLGTLLGFFEKHFSKANEPKKAPKYISDRKVSGLFLRNEHKFIPSRLRF